MKYQRKRARSITETINFVVKKCFGSKVHARKLKTQKLELLLKVLTYHLRRISMINKKINFALQFLMHQIRLFFNLFFKQIVFQPDTDWKPKEYLHDQNNKRIINENGFIYYYEVI